MRTVDALDEPHWSMLGVLMRDFVDRATTVSEEALRSHFEGNTRLQGMRHLVAPTFGALRREGIFEETGTLFDGGSAYGLSAYGRLVVEYVHTGA
jgi:hypothetical protein